MEKENILGFNVCISDTNNLIDNIFNDFDNNISNFIININPEIIVKNYKNTDLQDLFNAQKYQIPDGIGIVYASKIKHGHITKRISGIDLMNLICKESINHDAKIFLYGSKDGIAENAKNELKKSYPTINIVGTCCGYEDEKYVIDLINNSNANILFVGLGNPKQEEFIINNKEKLKNIKIFMPVGGSFDVISKNLKRAPKWMIKLNLEWLFRLFQQPLRFFRQLNILKFIFLVLTKKKNGGNKNGKN